MEPPGLDPGIVAWPRDWNATPLASNGYRARPLREPDRNDPCPCGSGGKYKRCCGGLGHLLPAITPEAAWQALASQLAVKEAIGILGTPGLPPEALAPLVRRLHEARRPSKILRLLDPHLQPPERLDARHEEALLLAFDLDVDHRGLEAATELALQRAGELLPELRAAVFRRLVPAAIESGATDLAGELLARARDDAPEHPDLAALEVLSALMAGDLDRARSRAAFWVAWLKRRGLTEEMAEVSALLEDTVRDADAARAALGAPASLETPPVLSDLATIVDGIADRPIRPYALTTAAGSVVFGRPSPDVAKAETAWAKAWPGSKPDLIGLHEESGTDVFERADRWLAVLRRHRPAFDSVSILDDLVLLTAPLAAGPFPRLQSAVVEPLLARAVALVRASLAGHEGSRLEWACLENRPALRLLTQEAMRLDEMSHVDEAKALFEWMLRLNPNDNQGHREWLVNHYLRTGVDERALGVASAYPADFLVATMFGRGLALWRLGRRAEAEEALRKAAADRPRVVRAILADTMAEPESSPYGVEVGGEEEAWIYREAMRDAWQATLEALSFLRSLPLPKARSRGRRRPPAGARRSP